jgi:hypothetical protein
MKIAHLFALTGILAMACTTAQAVPIFYNISLNGANESPPNASPGIGSGVVIIDTQAHLMSINLSFSGLLGNATVAHIHAATAVAGTGTAGVATTTPTFLGFPSGVTSGGYSMTFNMLNPSSYNPSFIAANGGNPFAVELALANAAAAGKAYFNLHTTVFPGGEIRGFLTPAANPIPDSGSTFALLGLTLASITGLRRKFGL